jgi:hypothetical protein
LCSINGFEEAYHFGAFAEKWIRACTIEIQSALGVIYVLFLDKTLSIWL